MSNTKERTPAQLAHMQKMRDAAEAKRLAKLAATAPAPPATSEPTETIEGGQVQGLTWPNDWAERGLPAPVESAWVSEGRGWLVSGGRLFDVGDCTALPKDMVPVEVTDHELAVRVLGERIDYLGAASLSRMATAECPPGVRTATGASFLPKTFPGAAIAVVIAAQHFGTGDALSQLPTTLPDELGVSWHAYRENDGTVTLLKEASRHVYDSNRARLSGVKEQLSSATRRHRSAQEHLEKNRDATGDMYAKLEANVTRFKKEVDEAQSVIDQIYTDCPALLRERLENEAEQAMAKVPDLEKKASKLRKSAAEWRSKGEDLQPQVEESDTPIDRNEIRAVTCEDEAVKLEAEIADRQSQSASKLREAQVYPEGPSEQKHVFAPGEVLGLTV